jgi:hypothetical protein
MQSADLIERNMIPERRRIDLANGRRIEEIAFSYEGKCHRLVTSRHSLAAMALQTSRDSSLDLCWIDGSCLFLGECPEKYLLYCF